MTTDDYTIEWASGLPLKDDQQDAMFYRGTDGWVCTIKRQGFEVDVYCDGDTRIKTQDGRSFRCGADLIDAGYDTDKNLAAAFESGELIHDMNSWFDLYVRGEHLDCVQHEINEAVEAGKAWLDEEVENANLIENGVSY